MGWQQAQMVLNWVATAFGLLGFSVSMAWHLIYRRKQYDWAERLARSLWIYLQCALWGTIVGFVAMDSFFNINFGGVK